MWNDGKFDLLEMSNACSVLYTSLDGGHDVTHMREVATTASALMMHTPVWKHAYVAGLLHDIGLVHGRVDHALQGAKMIEDGLPQLDGCPVEVTQSIAQAVREHGTTTSNDKAPSPIGRALMDADLALHSLSRMLGRSLCWTLDCTTVLCREQLAKTVRGHLTKKFSPNNLAARPANRIIRMRNTFIYQQLYELPAGWSSMWEALSDTEKERVGSRLDKYKVT